MLSVAISGCSVGGLSFALALARFGVTKNIHLLDEGRHYSQGSLWIGPGAAKMLEEVGGEDVKHTLEAHGVVTQGYSTYNGAGSLWGTAAIQGYGIQRELLLNAMGDALRRTTSRGPQWNAAIKRVLPVPARQEMILVESKSRPSERQVHLLVGADGITSMVRTACFGTQARPMSTGLSQWEVTVEGPSPDPAAPAHVQECWASGRKLLLWPSSRNGNLWTVVGFSKAHITPGSTFQQSTRSFKQFADEFAPFFDGPVVRDLLAAIRRNPEGRCTISNGVRAPIPYDAVHSTLPIMLLGDAVHGASLSGQWGCNLEIEDGYSAAKALVAADNNVMAALKAWEDRRKARWTAAVRDIRRQDLLVIKVGRFREGLRAFAKKWGGNALVKKELRAANEYKD